MELYGRKVIYTSKKEITRDNVIKVVQKSVITHIFNVSQITYLYDYYRGKQPILNRVKNIRKEINNKVVENRAKEIIDFKVGMVSGKPIKYIARETGMKGEEISRLNSMMDDECKITKDKDLVEWAMIAGTSYRFVAPLDENHPFETFTLDPREAFCIYNNGIGRRKLAGVYVSEEDEIVHYTVYTKDRIFVIADWKIVDEMINPIGEIPIIEYPNNRSRMGAFEPVVSLLDAINTIDSNRIDGIEQFVQSLIVCTNVNFRDENDKLKIREDGLICIKSLGENKAEIKILSEQLDQTQTQTLKDDLYDTVLTICAMPKRNSSGGSSDNGIAVVYRDGWSNAEGDAENFEATFKNSEREFIRTVLKICENLDPVNIEEKDIDITFTRGNYENMQSKAQVLTTMLGSDKIDPKLAFECCGIFTDPQSAYTTSMEWYEKETQADMRELNDNEDRRTEYREAED